MSVQMSTGAQRLKVTHCQDGSATGLLFCSVSLNMSQNQRSVFEDRLEDVAVSLMLNPCNGVFLADEVQRLMRLGRATWLRQQLSERHVQGISANDGQLPHTVHFSFNDLCGQAHTLAVDVEAASSTAEAVESALQRLLSWEQSLPSHAPESWVVEELLLAEHQHAPLMRLGLKHVQALA